MTKDEKKALLVNLSGAMALVVEALGKFDLEDHKKLIPVTCAGVRDSIKWRAVAEESRGVEGKAEE